MKWAVIVVLALALATVAFALLFEAEVGSATFGLALAGGALVLCLRSLHAMVSSLSSAGVETIVERDLVSTTADRRALREERRRLLRAINELSFDHAMGKLSDEDYRTVREGYELRAIEVIRALEAEPALDPELEQELRRRSIGEAASKGVDAPEEGAGQEPSSTGSTVACAACSGSNDVDARFCKHCGKELAA